VWSAAARRSVRRKSAARLGLARSARPRGKQRLDDGVGERVEVDGAAQAAELAVSGGWFRALPPSVPSGGYFMLRNNSSTTVTWVNVTSPACTAMMMHKTSSAGMDHVMALDVPAGATQAFAPGGYHLMCLDSKPMLKPGAAVPVTLEFEDGQKLTADFQVRTATGK
jgi:copper(I)-binding protein